MSYSIINLVVGVLLFSAMVIGISVFAGDIAENYDLSVEDQSVMNASSRMKDYAEDVSSSLENTQTQGWLGAGQFFLSSVVNSIMMMIGLTGIMGEIIINTSSLIFGIPAWFVSIIMTVVVFIVLFSIIRALTGRTEV